LGMLLLLIHIMSLAHALRLACG